MLAAIRRPGAAKKSGDRPTDFKQKEPSTPAAEDANKRPPREANNAERAMSPYNKMGITTEKWLKLPEAKQQRAAASAEVQDMLAAELSSMQIAGQAGGGKGAEAQALSDGEEDEAEYDSNFNERDKYAAEEHVGSAGEKEVTGDHSEADDQELPLDEMPDGVVDLVTARTRKPAE
ncbi:hypothetical protein CYMTET_3278 [Cymbomonas tetramitiformis]|uniref:Uncharacterized protein n=1 Tax=Cymbomonas tetramitiformis TaxID=36881 RepID=A0AAE0H3G0_9CHLO|nr:hypothetical protein CYMTET_3278 [Cymbomonas tetramitiformis]